MEHKKTHSNDAGATIKQVFPIPQWNKVYVCRLCCLAYGSRPIYLEHMAKHDEVLSCPDCSAICYNDKQLESHINSHKKIIVYGCSICMKAFKSEQRLHAHLSDVHERKSMFFCKVCGLGSTSEPCIISHIESNVCGTAKNADTVYKKMAVCAIRKLHYQPNNSENSEAVFKKAKEAKNCEMPGECTHRSFFGYCEKLLACDICCTLVPASKLIVESERFRSQKDKKFKLQLISDNHTFSPTIDKAHELQRNRQPAIEYNNVQTNVADTHDESGHTYALMPGTVPGSSSNQMVPIQLSAVRFPSDRIVPGLSVFVETSPKKDVILTTSLQETAKSNMVCPICKYQASSIEEFSVHGLRHTKDTFFCLDCGERFNREQNAIVHMIHQHDNRELEDGSVLFRCGLCAEFSTRSLQVFRKHMASNKCHINILEYTSSRCILRFGSEKARNDHAIQHANSNPDQHCCPLCGTCSMWNHAGISHINRHLCQQWLMCRECGTCFKKLHEFRQHCLDNYAENQGLGLRNYDVYKCSRCSASQSTELLSANLFGDHCQSAHMVIGLKRNNRRVFEFDEHTCRFYGV